jgi:hypothetical protein
MRGRRVGSPAQVPAAVEQLPGDLEGDEGLARAGGQRQQDALRPAAMASSTRSMAMSW